MFKRLVFCAFFLGGCSGGFCRPDPSDVVVSSFFGAKLPSVVVKHGDRNIICAFVKGWDFEIMTKNNVNCLCMTESIVDKDNGAMYKLFILSKNGMCEKDN